jgi:RNA polymerase sigma-70 factor (ECF subfamily)
LCLLKAFVSIKNFQGRSRVSSWLTSIAINTALMKLRQRRRRSECWNNIVAADSDYLALAERPDTRENPEQSAVRQESEESLRLAIGRLPRVAS